MTSLSKYNKRELSNNKLIPRVKKGFTLIELLAVVVILAVILLIAIPIVGNVIENSRVGAFKITASNIARSAEYTYLNNMMSEGQGERLEFYYDEKIETSNKAGYKLNYKGDKPDSGIVYVNKKGETSVTLYNNRYKLCATKNYNEEVVKIARNVSKENCEESINRLQLELINGEDFQLEIELGSSYVLSANDYVAYNLEEERSTNVEIYVDGIKGNIIDRSILNKEYKVIYKLIDDKEIEITLEKEQAIKIVDTTPPVIEVPENTLLKTSKVLNYNLREGVTVTDNSGEELDFEVLSELTPTPGNYIITYISTDSSGNKTEKIRQIEVIESIVSKQIIVTFEELLEGRSRSQKINIENLTEIENVTVNTGNVSYSLNGNGVTINVSNGSSTRTITNPTKYSKSATSYTTSGTDSFSYSKSYSDGEGYSGTLTKNGGSYVSSGSYTPADSKYVTINKFMYTKEYYKWNGTTWILSREERDLSDPIYNSNGYHGVLSDCSISTNITYDYYPYPDNPKINQEHLRNYNYGTLPCGGTVTKPASDTRIYRQNYNGTVYKSGNDNYYAYTVTINYKVVE